MLSAGLWILSHFPPHLPHPVAFWAMSAEPAAVDLSSTVAAEETLPQCELDIEGERQTFALCQVESDKQHRQHRQHRQNQQNLLPVTCRQLVLGDTRTQAFLPTVTGPDDGGHDRGGLGSGHTYHEGDFAVAPVLNSTGKIWAPGGMVTARSSAPTAPEG